MNLKQIFNIDDLESIFNSCSDEKETTITITGNSQTMTLYTSDSAMITKMKKLLTASNFKDIECYEAGRINGKVTGYFFKMNKKHLSLRATANKNLSKESRLAAKERFKTLASEGKLGRGRKKKTI